MKYLSTIGKPARRITAALAAATAAGLIALTAAGLHVGPVEPGVGTVNG
jgi:hypothetical protein